ncbi:hypothetical protein [Roseospira navarrensis]|uniref:Uncharacterized protein n=1 Tax=Roseospira navarrensis TaxID=140058 RepID=A0A7X1ZDV9_9PROT|nr:hypothetical protein [Roseospira navarrensis]MQX35597.1 hypothetical protein [Roseospira navarrensis]
MPPLPRFRLPVPAPAVARALCVLIPAGMTLAACGGGPSSGEVQDHMELFCQTHRCLCVEDGLRPFGTADKQEPDWALTGEPSCPPGYTLEEVDD